MRITEMLVSLFTHDGIELSAPRGYCPRIDYFRIDNIFYWYALMFEARKTSINDIHINDLVTGFRKTFQEKTCNVVVRSRSTLGDGVKKYLQEK